MMCMGWGLDSLLPLPGILVQLHFLSARGGSVSAGPRGRRPQLTQALLLAAAGQAGVRGSPRRAPACFQALQQSRE